MFSPKLVPKLRQALKGNKENRKRKISGSMLDMAEAAEHPESGMWHELKQELGREARINRVLGTNSLDDTMLKRSNPDVKLMRLTDISIAIRVLRAVVPHFLIVPRFSSNAFGLGQQCEGDRSQFWTSDKEHAECHGCITWHTHIPTTEWDSHYGKPLYFCRMMKIHPSTDWKKTDGE